MLVRRLTENDLDPFWDLRLRALKDDPEAFGSTYEETLARGKDAMLQRIGVGHGGDLFSLGAFDETLIGTVGYRRGEGLKERHQGFVFGMYVLPERRGKGAGKALMQDLLAQARRLEGVEQLNLAVVTTNQPAVGLYLALGFEIYGTAPRALKQNGHYWDEHLMLLVLAKT